MNKSCRWEPVHLSCNEGLVSVNSRSSSIWVEGRARQSGLREELVNMSCRWEPVHLSCSEGLVSVNSRSSSIWVVGRAREYEL